MKRIIEVCCGSYEDALNAYRGGASRIELNCALHMGGITPSLGTLLLTKRNTGLKVISMLRPRGAGFHYSDVEFETMVEDARLLMANDSDGLAFGFLDEDGEIQVERTRRIVEIIKKYHGEAVYHRAFDCVADPFKSMELLIDLGIDRVLTSGGEPKAMAGLDRIKALQDKYGDRIQLLAGSGVNLSNAKEIMDTAGIWQVHSSCKGWVTDPTTHRSNVNYAYAADPHESDYDIVSEEAVRAMVALETEI